MRCVAALSLALSLALLAGAGTGPAGSPSRAPAPAFAEGHLDVQVREIGRILRCPLCQNLNVADSPSPLAAQMRDLIREQLEAGKSRQEILAYFVERYGEEVLLDPPKTGFSLVVWWGAAAIPLAGAAMLASFLYRRRPRPATHAARGAFDSTGPLEGDALPLAGAALSAEERRAYEALLEREVRDTEPDRAHGTARGARGPW